MTTHPSVACRDHTVARAAQVLRDRRIGMLPVVDDLRAQHLLGVLTDHDIVVRCVAGGHDVRSAVGEYMTSGPLVCVAPDAAVTDAVGLMQRHRLRRLPVVDENGCLVGVVALADLATRMTPQEPDVLRAIELRVSGGHTVIPAVAG
jgi:CBS domain-containing protein